VEKVRKKPLSPKTEGIINQVGLALLVTLAVFVFYNDFVRFGARIFGK
jgi:membrane-associated protease RseP (regulator of RpoE activity)